MREGPELCSPGPIQVPRELSMFNKVPGSNVPLHHLPGHKVVICKEQELSRVPIPRPPGSMGPHRTSFCPGPVCPSVHLQ